MEVGWSDFGSVEEFEDVTCASVEWDLKAREGDVGSVFAFR